MTVAPLTCLHCGEEGEEDEGRPLRYVGLAHDGKPVALHGWVHRDCQLRMVLGGPAHLLGVCSCNHGVGCDPDMGLSKREAARVVAQWHYLERE